MRGDGVEMQKKRVPAHRSDEVARRLRGARGAVGLGSAAKMISEASEALGWSVLYSRTDVRRFEWGDPKRKPKQPVDYVRAAARAFGREPAWLLAEDLGHDLSKLGAEMLRRGHRPAPPLDQGARSLAERYQQVVERLRSAGRFPVTPGPPLGQDPLQEPVDELMRLFRSAFEGRGISRDRLLELADAVGAAFVAPEELPPEGFLWTEELTEEQYRTFWQLQLRAFATVMRAPGTTPSASETQLRDHEDAESRGVGLTWDDRVKKWASVRPAGQ